MRTHISFNRLRLMKMAAPMLEKFDKFLETVRDLKGKGNALALLLGLDQDDSVEGMYVLCAYKYCIYIYIYMCVCVCMYLYI